MREKRVESELTKLVRGVGGWCVKILPSISGLPDRLVILPGGRIHFVELKSPTGTVAPHQTVVHRRLKELGCPVAILPTVESVRAWVAEVSEAV